LLFKCSSIEWLQNKVYWRHKRFWKKDLTSSLGLQQPQCLFQIMWTSAIVEFHFNVTTTMRHKPYWEFIRCTSRVLIIRNVTILTSPNHPKCECTWVIWTCKNMPDSDDMSTESNTNASLVQKMSWCSGIRVIRVWIFETRLYKDLFDWQWLSDSLSMQLQDLHYFEYFCSGMADQDLELRLRD